MNKCPIASPLLPDPFLFSQKTLVLNSLPFQAFGLCQTPGPVSCYSALSFYWQSAAQLPISSKSGSKFHSLFRAQFIADTTPPPTTRGYHGDILVPILVILVFHWVHAGFPLGHNHERAVQFPIVSVYFICESSQF